MVSTTYSTYLRKFNHVFDTFSKIQPCLQHIYREKCWAGWVHQRSWGWRGCTSWYASSRRWLTRCLPPLGALYETHIVAPRTPNSNGVIRDKLRMSSPDAPYRTAEISFSFLVLPRGQKRAYFECWVVRLVLVMRIPQCESSRRWPTRCLPPPGQESAYVKY